jgi:PhnB protein
VAQTSTYLNFEQSCEAAFEFYKQVFGTEYAWPITRYGAMPAPEGAPALSAEHQNLIMNVALPILGGHLLMGSDVPAFTGQTLREGNRYAVCLMPDTRTESDALFAALSDGGEVFQPMHEAFWGDYYGEFKDKFGISWMIVCASKE